MNFPGLTQGNPLFRPFFLPRIQGNPLFRPFFLPRIQGNPLFLSFLFSRIQGNPCLRALIWDCNRVNASLSAFHESAGKDRLLISCLHFSGIINFPGSTVVFKSRKLEKSENRQKLRIRTSLFQLTLYTLTSVCIFSILFSIHFLRYW